MAEKTLLNNPFLNWFEKNKGKYSSKWNNYFEIYHRYLSPFIGKKIRILEIGVNHGGSLDMWKDVFGQEATVFGLDINPETKKFENDQIQIFIGDVCDSSFLNTVIKQIEKIDVLIDDGGHYMTQQKVVLDKLFSIISDQGIYMCEDVHTSYQNYYGGGLNYQYSFMEYVKKYIDILHVPYWGLKSSYLHLSNSIKSIHFYDSVVVIEKYLKKEMYRSIESGTYKLDNYSNELRSSFFQKIYYRILLYRSMLSSFLFRL